MVVRWPDGSETGSVKVATSEPAPVEPETVETIPEAAAEEPTPERVSEKKEASNGNR